MGKRNNRFWRMQDNKKNKTNSEVIRDLKLRTYGEAGIATYKNTYDSVLSRRTSLPNDSLDGYVC